MTAPGSSTSAHATHDDHDDHGPDPKQTFILAAAGLWSIVFTVIVYMAITGWFIPNVRADIPTAIISTARIVGLIGVAALVHVAIQLALITNRPGREAPLWQKTFDYATSFAPLVGGVLFGHFMAAQYDSESFRLVGWWLEIRFWIDAIVVLSLGIDLYPTIKIMIFGRSRSDDHH